MITVKEHCHCHQLFLFQDLVTKTLEQMLTFFQREGEDTESYSQKVVEHMEERMLKTSHKMWTVNGNLVPNSVPNLTKVTGTYGSPAVASNTGYAHFPQQPKTLKFLPQNYLAANAQNVVHHSLKVGQSIQYPVVKPNYTKPWKTACSRYSCFNWKLSDWFSSSF